MVISNMKRNKKLYHADGQLTSIGVNINIPKSVYVGLALTVIAPAVIIILLLWMTKKM